LNGWPEVRLDDVCEERTGTRDPTKLPDKAFRYVDISSVDNKNKRILAAGNMFGHSAPSRARQIIKLNDVLVSMTRPNLNAVAMCPAELDGEICSTGFAVLRSKDTLSPSYLFHFVRSRKFIEATTSAVSGALYPAITSSFLRSLYLPFPPLDEQRRIVGLLDRAAEIRRRADAARATARAIIPALFLDTFGDPATNPKGWPVAELSTVADIGSGLTKGRKLSGQDTVATPYLRVANVQDGFLNLSEIKLIDATAADLERTVLRAGDLLMTEGGDPDKLGRCAIWREEVEGCLHQNHIFRVRVGQRLLPEYTAAFIQSDGGKSYFLRVAKRTTGIASINKTQLGAFPILVPSMRLQAAFTEQARRVELLACHLDAAAAKAQAMAAGLSAEFFG
jgi:type I restriction enzyme, S subunit